MINITEHNIVKYLFDGMLIACTWTYQQLPLNNIDWINILGTFGEVIDLSVKPTITLVLLLTAIRRYRKETKNTSKVKSDNKKSEE